MNPLSYLSLLALVLYADSGIRIFRLAPERRLNRLAFGTYALLALWAFDAVFAYVVIDPGVAEVLYRSFAWTWCLFFGMVLHLSLELSGTSVPIRPLNLIILYGPGLIALWAHQTMLLEGFDFRGGYWMARLSTGPEYWLFTVYNVGYCLLSIVVLVRARLRASGQGEKRRLGIVIYTMLGAFLGGFVTDTIAVILRLDIPNLGILWIGVWAVGIRYALLRYGMFAPLPIHAARRFLDALDDAVFYLDEEGHIVWSNRATEILAEDSLRRGFGDASGKSIGQLLNLDARDAADAEAVLRGERSFLVVRSSIRTSGYPAELYLRSLLMENPPLAGTIGAIRDLSARRRLKEAEASIADRDTLFGRFIEASQDAICLADTDGRIVHWNKAMESLTGLSADSARGRSMWDVQAQLFMASSLPRAVWALEHALKAASEEGVSPPSLEEFQIRDLSGRAKTIQSSIFAIPLRRGVVAAAVSRDVTEEKRAQAAALEAARRLDQAQKMEAVGNLTGGIAHDFNNILTGVLGTASYLKLVLVNDEGLDRAELLESVETIERAGARASDLVRHLLDLVRKRPREEKPVRLDELLNHVVELTRSSRDPSVRLEYDPPSEDAKILGDGTQIEQVLLNLLINAEESMTLMRAQDEPRGGRIRLWVERFFPDADFLLAYPQAAPRPYWLLHVADQGVGVPQSVADRIFDPFFTTKEGGKSSGLGLSMVYTIARQHGGFVDFLSEAGRGTEFKVWLPAVELNEAEAAHPAVHYEIHKGQGKVLVVDDEEIPRHAAAALLRALGYEAVLTAGAAEALEVYEEAAEKPVAVIVDLAMPHIDGREALSRFKARDPGLPVLVSSGFAAEDLVAGCLKAGAAGFIPKPYTAAELGAGLERALRAARPTPS